MKKKMIKSISILLALCMLVMTGVVLISANAAETKLKIYLDRPAQVRGRTVEVGIKIMENPGFSSMDLEISFNTSVLELIECRDSELIKKYNTTGNTNVDTQVLYPSNPAHSNDYDSARYHFCWDNDLDYENSNKLTGLIATLVFRVKENAPMVSSEIKYKQLNWVVLGDSLVYVNNENTCITKSVPKSGYNGVYDSVVMDYEISHLIGDVNGNGVVNSADFTILSRFVAGKLNNLNSFKNIDAGDLNRNSSINSADFTILSRYIAGKTGANKYIIDIIDN